MFYQAHFQFIDYAGKVCETRIVFSALTIDEAVRGPLRWWKNRHEAVPEHFHHLGYFQCAPYTIDPIRDDGYCSSGSGFRLFEWSQDRAGMDAEAFVDYMSQKLTKASK